MSASTVPLSGALAGGPIRPVVPVLTVASDSWRAAVELRGEIDAAVAAGLRAELDKHVDAGRRTLRIGVRDVTFMDSTAIGVLADVHARLARSQGSMIVTGVGRPVARLLALTGLDAVLLVDTAGNGYGDHGAPENS